MSGSTMVTIAVLLFFVFFIFYKRDLVMRLFSVEAQTPANELQERLERTADNVIWRLEEKIAYLEALLKEADQKIELLESKVARDGQDENGDSPVPEISFMPPARAASLYQQNSLQPAKDRQEEQPRPEAPAMESKGRPIPQDKHKVIVAMAEQGFNVTEIAKAVGMGKGEIMLVLQLNKK